MTDPDEIQLSKLAKKMLAMPPKKREDSKFGKPRAPPRHAIDVAVKSGSKHRKASYQNEMPTRPPGSPTYAKPVIVFGIEKVDGEWRSFKPYCLLPDGRIESINLASSG